MTKRMFYLIAVVFLIAPALRASPPIGAVVQTWHYNPQTKAATITLVNTTQKDILAFNLSITETFADGSTDSHEVMIDWLDRMLNAQQVKGTTEEARFTQQFGNGTFAAGTTTEVNDPVSKVVTNARIAVDMVAYADRTADIENQQAFAQLIAQRRGELLALQQANEVIEQSLTNPNPSETAATELKRRISVLHAQNLAPTDPQTYESTHLQGAVNTLQNAHNAHPPLTETEYLKNIVVMGQQRIALFQPHLQLTKGEGQ